MHKDERINRCIKKRNVECNVVSPPQLYVHGCTDSILSDSSA